MKLIFGILDNKKMSVPTLGQLLPESHLIFPLSTPQVYQSLVSKRLEAGEDPYPITYCQRVPPKVYEKEKSTAVQSALADLLEHLLTSEKLSLKEKRKKLAKFREAYPMIYRERFPDEGSEPDWIRGARKGGDTGAAEGKKFSSLSRLKNAIRL